MLAAVVAVLVFMLAVMLARLAHLSVAGLFGDSDGAERGVSHYRLKPVAEAAA